MEKIVISKFKFNNLRIIKFENPMGDDTAYGCELTNIANGRGEPKRIHKKLHFTNE